MSALVLTPSAPPKRPFPRAVAAGTVLLVIASAATHDRATWPSVLFGAGAVIGCCGLGTWLEDRLFTWARSRSALKRFVLAMLVPPVAVLLLGPAMALAAIVSQMLSSATTPVLLACTSAAAIWVASAGVGSLVVLVLDLVISALVPDFKSRIVAAVFTLIALATGAVGLATTALTMAATTWPSFVAKIQSLVGKQFDPRGIDLGGWWLLPEDIVSFAVLFAAVLGVLLALPALLSACSKLADAVMERVNPLGRAFELLGSGELGVRVDEGGSAEFSKLNRAFNQMVEALLVARGMERAFGAYLGEPIVERIRLQHGQGALPAMQREATVIFADIRGFTAMSEKLAPAQVMDLLNRYLERAVAVIEQHEGYINKFIGDAIVVVFNGPIDQTDHARRGARCALALQDEIARMNAAGAFPEVGTLPVGIGIATGPLVAGNLGGKRTEYTVIGDTVNLAARLTSHAGPGEVWANEANARAQDVATLRCEALAPLKVKGKEVTVSPFRLVNLGAAAPAPVVS